LDFTRAGRDILFDAVGRGFGKAFGSVVCFDRVLV